MTRLVQTPNLELERCPHCSVAKPLMVTVSQFESKNHAGQRSRQWAVYTCRTCGGAVLTAVPHGQGQVISEIYPTANNTDESIPERARAYLDQAVSSLHAPAGAIMLAASSVDAMLKAKGKKTGSLYARIDEAAAEHLITQEMAAWAHEVRLDANDQRHADENAPLPTAEEAQRAIEFTLALGELLFVLPSRVQRGRSK